MTAIRGVGNSPASNDRTGSERRERIINTKSLQQRGGAWATGTSVIAAIASSACCWLPLSLLVLGISGGTIAATFEQWRPVFLPLAFLLLGIAFYLTYRKPGVAVQCAGETSSTDGTSCCSAPAQGTGSGNYCPPGNSKGFTLKKLNKGMLWVAAAVVLAFTFFPNYVGALLGGNSGLASREDLKKVVVMVDGMTGKASEATIEKTLLEVPGVAGAEVSYEKAEALLGIKQDAEVSNEAILAAISKTGYKGWLTALVQWDVGIEGMTCDGCASHIRANLLKVPGVKSAKVSYKNGSATVTADTALKPEALREAVGETGYLATTVEKTRSGAGK